MARKQATGPQGARASCPCLSGAIAYPCAIDSSGQGGGKQGMKEPGAGWPGAGVRADAAETLARSRTGFVKICHLTPKLSRMAAALTISADESPGTV